MYILVLSLLIPVVLLLSALFFLKFPPKHINNLYGYRTKRSKKSVEAWDFAQVYAAKNLLYLSLAEVLVSILLYIFWFKNFNQSSDYIAFAIVILVQTFSVLGVLVITEIKLVQKFKNKV